MALEFFCPYCGQPKLESDNPFSQFSSCRFCGYRSALVETGKGILLIVDRRMPFLERRCRELYERQPDVTIIVDRRITQDPFLDKERRIRVD